jgi:hypothetical protein
VRRKNWCAVKERRKHSSSKILSLLISEKREHTHTHTLFDGVGLFFLFLLLLLLCEEGVERGKCFVYDMKNGKCDQYFVKINFHNSHSGLIFI